jgi:tRNA A37 threonylcarbamoyladenosine biosynthesis protein TsaE/BMFP domain-containing protein YqiC
MAGYDDESLKRIREEEEALLREVEAEEAARKTKKQKTLVPVTSTPSPPQQPVDIPWFLRELVEPPPSEPEALLMTWEQALTFAARVEGMPGPRNAPRPPYLKCLEDLQTYVKNWKQAEAPLHLIGDVGSGKTSLLKSLGRFLKLEVELLHDIFLDPPTQSVLEQLGTCGLTRTPKLWVVEHYDTLSPQWLQALKRKGLAAMMKTGCVVLTSWTSSKQKPANALELTAWSADTKLKFLKQPCIQTHLGFPLSVQATKFILEEAGESLCGSLASALVWGSTLSDKRAREDDDCAPPPVNVRILVEESFTMRWNVPRTLTLEASDIELSLDLLQELCPSAASVGRCDIAHTARQLHVLSNLDLVSRTCSDVCRTVLSQRMLQRATLEASTSSLSRFSSGTLIPLPQSLVSLSKAKPSALALDQTVLKCRGMLEEGTEHLRDTRRFHEDVQFFSMAAGQKWVSSFKTK